MMENRFPRSKCLSKNKFVYGEERELYSITYDSSSESQEIWPSAVSLVNNFKKSSSQQTEYLTVEVEISDSLKRIIASPDTHASEILNVTIVRPEKPDNCTGLEEEVLTCQSSQIQNLIATMEREKRKRGRLTEQCQKRAAPSKMKPILEMCETPSENSGWDVAKTLNHKHNHARRNGSVGRGRQKIEAASAPVEPESKRGKKDVGHKKLCATSSIRMLKPLVGEVRQSLRNLEARIVQAGDHQPLTGEKHYPSSSFSSDSFGSSKPDNLKYPCGLKMQQVYATANPYSKLRTLLACQNDNPTQSKDRPCMCQHCGMVGLLVESQKHPVLDHAVRHNDPNKENSVPKPVRATRSRPNLIDNSAMKMLLDINARLDNLESRMTAQEHRAVQKSYFRRIIGKLVNSQTHEDTYEFRDSKNVYTQYSKIGTDNDCYHRQRSSKDHHNRSVYCVSPITVSSQTHEFQNHTTVPKKIVTNKAISTNLINEESLGAQKENPRSKEKGLWRWGEEIIRPGFDLKTKIMSLLEEQFVRLAGKRETEDKSCSTQRSSRAKVFQNNATSASNLFEDPLPYEDKEARRELKYNSNQTLKHVLDLMSEKIYNDHVKPTVNAMKDKQFMVNKGNAKEIYNINAATKETVSNICSKHIQKAPTKDETYSSNKNPHLSKLPCSFPKTSSTESVKNSKYQKSGRSGIPVRVGNASITTASISESPKHHTHEKKPRLPVLSSKTSNTITDTTSTKESDKHYNRKREDPGQKLKKLQLPDTDDSSAVYLRFKSSKVGHWNEESSGSLPEEIQQLMFGNTYTKGYCNHDKPTAREDKRRTADNLSATDKLAFLTNMTSAEMGKTQLWSNIWRQAKTHCKSNEDTIIIQVPTNSPKTNKPEVKEFEFTIDDIQKLINTTKCPKETPKEPKNRSTVDSFLLIRSKKILDEVQKKVGATFNKPKLV